MKKSRFTDRQIIAVLKQAEAGLHDENRRLKKVYAEAQLSADLLKEAMSRSGEAISVPGDGPKGGRRRGSEHPARLPDLRGERDLLPL